jgi:nicotinamide-nucleotide amidase
MARGALGKAEANLAVAITGIAGPGGGSPGKPVGLVHFATASRGGALTHKEIRYGKLGRIGVRRKSVLQALLMLRTMAEKHR